MLLLQKKYEVSTLEMLITLYIRVKGLTATEVIRLFLIKF